MTDRMTASVGRNMKRIAAATGPVFALGTDYPGGQCIPAHSHDRHQLLHALSGILLVSTGGGRWILPEGHALWVPAGCMHRVEMLGPVRMRSVYVRRDLLPDSSDDPRVLGVTALVRALVNEAVEMMDHPGIPDRDRLIAELLLHEIPRLPVQPLALPLPHDPRLLRLCRAFMAAPDTRTPLDGWAGQAGMSRRSLSRHFRQETGLSLEKWRQQACVFAALPRLIAGDRVTTVALDLGYDSPAAFTTMFRRMLGHTPRRYASGARTPP